MRKFIILAIAILTAFTITVWLFHQTKSRPFTTEDFWLALIEISAVILIYALGELLLNEDKKQIRSLIARQGQIQQDITFVNNFEDYCIECKKAIEAAQNNSHISTIQTPIILDADNSANSHDFQDYIIETARQLLVKNPQSNSPKIVSYQRLIVINNEMDTNEINEEKKKLTYFVDAIYSALNSWNDSWKPDLRNIHIGLIKSKDIYNSPFSNLDVLLVENSHLVIGFPMENNQNYIWGTSLHISNRRGHVESYVPQAPKFRRIYQAVWDSPNIKKIDFGSIHDINNLGNSKSAILSEINSKFSELLS